MSLRATASQTVGPFFAIGFAWGYVADLAGPGARVAVAGRLLDGDGAPVDDGVLEIWDPAARAFGRVPTDAEGRFRFTVGARGGGGHLSISVFARGVLNRLATRMYFPDPGADPVLELVPVERRGTLVARQVADGSLEWDVILQGPGETVFFEV